MLLELRDAIHGTGEKPYVPEAIVHRLVQLGCVDGIMNDYTKYTCFSARPALL